MSKRFYSMLIILLFFTNVSCSSTNNNEHGIISESMTECSKPESYKDTKEDTIIVMTSFGGLHKQIQNAVEQFNELDNGYKVEVKDYKQFYIAPPSNYVGDDLERLISESYDLFREEAFDDFHNKVGADIISYSTDSELFETLKQESCLSDLHLLLEEDTSFNLNQLNSAVVDLCKTDDKLYELPVFYEISTLIGARKYLGNQDTWTINELIDCYDSVEGNLLLTESNTRHEACICLVNNNIQAYIEDLNGNLSFMDEELKNTLNFCMRFSYDSRILNKENENDPYLIKLLQMISGFGEYHSEMQSFEKRNGDATIVGFPSSKGYHSNVSIGESFGINNESSQDIKMGACEFLKFVSSDKQSEFTFGFPVNNIAFSIQAKQKIEEGKLNQKELDELANCINNTKCRDSSKNKYYHELFNGIPSLFNGNQNVDECINRINHQIVIYEKARKSYEKHT